MSVSALQKWQKRGLFEGILLLHNHRAAHDGISGVKVRRTRFSKLQMLQGRWLAVSGKARHMCRCLPPTELESMSRSYLSVDSRTRGRGRKHERGPLFPRVTQALKTKGVALVLSVFLSLLITYLYLLLYAVQCCVCFDGLKVQFNQSRPGSSHPHRSSSSSVSVLSLLLLLTLGHRDDRSSLLGRIA